MEATNVQLAQPGGERGVGETIQAHGRQWLPAITMQELQAPPFVAWWLEEAQVCDVRARRGEGREAAIGEEPIAVGAEAQRVQGRQGPCDQCQRTRRKPRLAEGERLQSAPRAQNSKRHLIMAPALVAP